MTGTARLAVWYEQHGRHDLPWRATRERWPVLVAEVMLQQTQVNRVLGAWPAFMAEFPTPVAMASRRAGDAIAAWSRLGYPRRARRLWETATIVVRSGWPADLQTLPGIGRYTARALVAQCDDADEAAVEVNVRRVVQRCEGRVLSDRDAERASVRWGRPLLARDRLLALMDLGATVCTAREPRCNSCPLHRRCASRGPLDGEVRSRQAPFRGSFRERRGLVMEALRTRARVAIVDLDDQALSSLVDDALVEVSGEWAQLP